MIIDPAEVRRIAGLAHLELDDAAVDTFARDLRSILDHVALLDEVDVSATEPMASSLEPAEPSRDDVVRPGLGAAEALANAPNAADGHFRVPGVLEE